MSGLRECLEGGFFGKERDATAGEAVSKKDINGKVKTD